MSYSDGTAVIGQHGQEVQSNCFIRKCLLKLKLYIKKKENSKITVSASSILMRLTHWLIYKIIGGCENEFSSLGT